MALFNLFKPKWQHSDPKVRLTAVQHLADTDLDPLCQLATSDSDGAVRQAALARINDWPRLLTLVPGVADPVVQAELAERIDTLRVLAILAAPGVEAKRAILLEIHKEALLAKIAVEEADADIRLAAVERMSDQGLLLAVVGNNCGKAPALAAIAKITDEALLRQAAERAASRSARALAQQKVEAIETERNRPILLEKELTALLAQARELNTSSDLDAAITACQALHHRWREIAPTDEPRTPEIDRCCEEIRSRHHEQVSRLEARAAAQRRHDQLLERLREIITEINALAQGAQGDEDARFAMLQQEWAAIIDTQLPELFATLGTRLPDELWEGYADAGTAFASSRTLVAHESVEEANLLQALASIPTLLEADELEKVLDSLSEAQRAFYGWQPQLVSRRQVTERLESLRDQHRAAVARQAEARAVILQENLAKRQELLQEMNALVTAEDLKLADQRMKELKEQWRRPVELPADAPDLQPQFAEISRVFAQKLVALRQQETWQQWQNKNLKSQLITEAAALDEDTDLRQVFKRIKELQASWRAVGPAPAKEENILWRQFHQATDRNFVRCRAFFQAMEEEAERNYQEKCRLRDEAIAHQESTAWQKSADFIRDLQAQWKKVGRAPQEKEQEVFEAFRAACDHFFERRKVHHQALDQERLAHLAEKEALCAQAEAWAEQPDVANTPKFQELQQAWKAIGAVPKGQEEAIWHRFRAACDRHYAWLEGLRPENLAQKEALCVEVEQLTDNMTPETNFIPLAKKIVTLQQRWKEIGPVPKEDHDAIWQRFKGRCDAFFAAKNNHDRALDAQRPANQAKKEALLARVKELSGATITRETVREITAMQEEWRGVGPAAKEPERLLQQEFKAVCDTFFKERREVYQQVDQINRENLKKKEALCLRLEILAGVNPQPVADKGQGSRKGGLTLAEQLKVAFETNFVLSAEDSRDKKRRAKDEIEAVKQEWQQIGVVPREHEHSIRKRYTEALAAAMAVPS